MKAGLNQKIRALKSESLLLLAAIIWGFAFVAQREGMAYIGPLAFNAIRFTLGTLSLIPIALATRAHMPAPSRKTLALGSGLTGVVLFIAASLQQIGVVYTTAGKAGFITGLYVILVPILGLGLKHRTGRWTWLGAVGAVIGLYLLTVTESFTIEQGDRWVMFGAFFWAIHVHLLSEFAPRIGAIRLALIQFAICSLLSFGAALLFETIRLADVVSAAVPILYTGILSVGVAYTLQVVGQTGAPPAQAAIILSLETVFAVAGGWLILSERLALRGLVGCALMFAGMIVSQLDPKTQTVAALDEE